MKAFQSFIVLFWLALLAYTLATISRHGLNLLPIFFGDIAAMTWPGQFNFDFLGFLCLSMIWVAWRHQFRPAGLALGVLALFGGMGFLAPYLLWTTAKAKGDVKIMLLGPERAAR